MKAPVHKKWIGAFLSFLTLDALGKAFDICYNYSEIL